MLRVVLNSRQPEALISYNINNAVYWYDVKSDPPIVYLTQFQLIAWALSLHSNKLNNQN